MHYERYFYPSLLKLQTCICTDSAVCWSLFCVRELCFCFFKNLMASEYQLTILGGPSYLVFRWSIFSYCLHLRLLLELPGDTQDLFFTTFFGMLLPRFSYQSKNGLTQRAATFSNNTFQMTELIVSKLDSWHV